jgi:hypothetical protein
MRTLALALAVLAAAPATSSADPFGELPYRSLSGAANCVRAAGAPGVLSRESGDSLQFMQAGAGGLQDTDSVKLTNVAVSCTETALAASGAGVVAAREFGPGDPSFRLVATTRDPGGTWAKPQALAGGELPPSTLIAAASARGDAAVAWVDSAHVFSGPYRLRLARRGPGGAFGQPVTVFRTTGDDPAPSVAIALAAGGELVAAWTRRDPATKGIVVEAALAPPGGALGAPQRIGQARGGTPPALAVAPDGSALLAYAAGTELRVAERAPGGAFGAPVKVATADDVVAVTPAAALGPGGEAAVGWQSVLQEGVGLVTRARAGAFGPPVVLARNRTIPPALAERVAAIVQGLGDLGSLNLGGGLRVALAGDRALAGWIRTRRPGGLHTREAHGATLPLAGGHLETHAFGGTLRDVDSAAPVVLADGRAGLAWADDGPNGTQGRVHFALAGVAPAARPPVPVVRIGRPRASVLAAADPLRVPITCSAACDVRLQRVGRADTDAVLSLRAAGTRTLVVDAAGQPIAHRRRGPIRFRLATGPPGGPATVRTVSFTLRRRPEPPAPRVLGLTAVRHGSVITVSWHTNRRVGGFKFFVAGVPRHAASDNPIANVTPVFGGRHWSLQLSPARGVRWVYVQYIGGTSPGKPVFARVR